MFRNRKDACYLMFLLLLFAQAPAVVVVLADVLAHVVHSVHQHLQAFLEMRAGAKRKARAHQVHSCCKAFPRKTANIYRSLTFKIDTKITSGF